MDFQFDADNQQRQRTLRQFMERHVLPQLREYERITPRRACGPGACTLRGRGGRWGASPRPSPPAACTPRP